MRSHPPPLPGFPKMTHTRTESFVPLTSAPSRPPGDRAEFKVTVISQPGPAQNFQPLSATAVSSIANAAPKTPAGEPKVSVQRDGNRVTGIHVHCSCGQLTELSCVYDAAAPQPAVDPQLARQGAGDPGPEAATIPQPAPTKPAPGKICKGSGKDLPTSAAKKPKVPAKGGGTSAAKRRST
jgi:hypothetical protein